MLGRTGQQITAQTDRIAKTAGSGFAQQFARAGQVDPTKLASTAAFAQQGTKAGKAMGDSAADAIKRGDFQGAARDAARTFEMTFVKVAKPKATVDTSQMQRDGGSAGDNFASGFASAGGIARLAGKGGPVAGAIIAATATAVKVVKPMIEEAMQFQADVRLNQAKLGIDDKQMQGVTEAATNAWAHNFGESISQNLSTAVTAGLSGLKPDQDTIQALSTISTILGVEIPEAARAAGQLIRTGLAANAREALDIITAGQREGLNVSGDWIDTITEYSTQFRKLGLTGADAIGILKQGLQGGARDTDKMADALKELSIRAVDGSKTTTQAFEALGLNATDTAAKFAQGGQIARDAFGQVTDKIRGIQDPLVQSKIAVALMGTQAEDLGAAFTKIDLSKAASSIKEVQGATQNAADTALKTSQSEWQQAGRNIQAVWTKVKQSMNLDDLFSGIPKAFNDLFEDAPTLTPGAPGVPITGPRVQGPGIQGGINLPITGAPGVTGGNPLDILRGGLPGGVVDYKSWYPAAAPPPAPTQITPNALTDPSLADSGGGDKKPQLPTLPYTGPNPQEYLAQQGVPLTSSTFGAAQSVLEAQQRIAQLKSDVTTLEKADVKDQGDLIAKRNDLVKAQQDQTKTMLSFQESARQAVESFNKTMGTASDSLSDIGAQLDSDLGISKGLPGLADNLVRFIASLAAAPLQGMLAPFAAQNKGGSGILGMLGVGQGTPQQSYANGLQPGAPYSPGSAKPGESARDFAHRVMMPFFEQQGLTVGDHQADGYGEHQNGALDIMVDSIAQGNKVLAQVLSDPNVYGAIFNNQAYGYGQGPGARPYSGGNTGNPTQDHQDHVHAWYKPGGPNNIVPSTFPSATPGATFPSSVTPYSQGAPGAPLPAPGSFPGGGGAMAPGMPQGFGQGGFAQSYTPGTPAEQAAPSWTPQGGGGLGVGGLAGAAIQGAIGAGGMFPGGQAASAAAQMAMQAINRTIAFGGQAAGIGLEGLMQTFGVSDPDGGGSSLGASWIQRIAGGLAGVKPAGNMAAGKADQGSKIDPNDPRNQQGQPGQPGQPGQLGQSAGRQGPTVHIENFVAPDRNAQQIPQELAWQTANAQLPAG